MQSQASRIRRIHNTLLQMLSNLNEEIDFAVILEKMRQLQLFFFKYQKSNGKITEDIVNNKLKSNLFLCGYLDRQDRLLCLLKLKKFPWLYGLSILKKHFFSIGINFMYSLVGNVVRRGEKMFCDCRGFQFGFGVGVIFSEAVLI